MKLYAAYGYLLVKHIPEFEPPKQKGLLVSVAETHNPINYFRVVQSSARNRYSEPEFNVGDIVAAYADPKSLPAVTDGESNLLVLQTENRVYAYYTNTDPE